MATLTGNITASTKEIPTDASLGYYELGAELIQLVDVVPPLVPLRDPPTGRMVARRGIGGSTAASHSSGATLTRYDPEAPGGEGGAGTPGPYEDPTITTPESHANWHITKGDMEGPP